MTVLRLVMAICGAATIAAVGAGIVVPRHAAPPPPPTVDAAPVAAATPTLPAATPVPALREVVPPGILARAAQARALQRAPACAPPPQEQGDTGACAPQRDAVEIDWDVGPRR